jgi:hypothetical protein
MDSATLDSPINPASNIPGLIKDNICIKGRTMSCASRILEQYTAVYDATVITKLRHAGAVFLGRANMDEFAMGSSTETSAYFKTKNPWDVSDHARRLRPSRDRAGWVARPVAPRSLIEQRVGAACYVQRKEIVRSGDARAAVAHDLVGAVGAKRQETLTQIFSALHAATFYHSKKTRQHEER